jgi:hypothetical protein
MSKDDIQNSLISACWNFIKKLPDNVANDTYNAEEAHCQPCAYVFQ